MNSQSPSQQTRVRKFLRPDATPLTPEAIKEIRNAPENIPNACRVMCKKYHIGTKRYEDIINNRMPSEPTKEWRRIIEEAELRGSVVTPASSVNKTCVACPPAIQSRTTPRHVYICALCDTQPPGSAEIFTKLDTKSEALPHEAVVPLPNGQVSVVTPDSYERESLDSPLRATNMDSMVPPQTLSFTVGALLLTVRTLLFTVRALLFTDGALLFTDGALLLTVRTLLLTVKMLSLTVRLLSFIGRTPEIHLCFARKCSFNLQGY
ncbi:700_t:CDS:2 [Paraglomus occultum]|uniref:700_t:CDS:1 n=1 Tax=Paraglomus occultum TaxID=144539 RepID=A0A9N9CI16_9GLOM|nr:700_t:CDS:2 [Paraglomus occultum]